MARLLSILVLILDVIVILDILRSEKDNERKVLWVIAVIFLPLIGPLLYYIVGKGR